MALSLCRTGVTVILIKVELFTTLGIGLSVQKFPEIYSIFSGNFPQKLLNGRFLVLKTMNEISGALILLVTNWTFQKHFFRD